MYSTSSTASQDSERCKLCGSQDNLHRFPCNHSYCANCIITKQYSILNTFKSILIRDIFALKNKHSNFGCLQNCEKSKLSISKNQVLSFLQTSTVLSNAEKNEFLEILNLSLGFFFGVKVMFFICSECQRIKGNVGCMPLVCKRCIGNLYTMQTSIRPKNVVFEWVLDYDSFHSRDEILNDFVLVNTNHLGTYDCMHHDGNYSIKLADRSTTEIEVLLLRVMIIRKSPKKIIIWDYENTVQIVSKVRLIMN